VIRWFRLTTESIEAQGRPGSRMFLTAIGLTREEALATVRISAGRLTRENELRAAVRQLEAGYRGLSGPR
jgi:cysteine sulfinate desulfinase/cysteine desulfurase-like protein